MTNSARLRRLADTHEERAEVADALDGEVAVAYHLTRAEELRIEAARIEADGTDSSDATEQSLALYVAQAEATRELLDKHAPDTTGNLQTRLAQVFARGVTGKDGETFSQQTPMTAPPQHPEKL
jgi:hypothetical protein